MGSRDQDRRDFWQTFPKSTLMVLVSPVFIVLDFLEFFYRIAFFDQVQCLIHVRPIARNWLSRCIAVVQPDYRNNVKVVWSRIVSAYNISLGHLFQITVYNIFAFVCHILRLTQLYRGLEENVETFMCSYFCGFYITESGAVYTYSTTNMLSTSFDIPEEYAVNSTTFPIIMDKDHLPSGGSLIDHPFNCHFMMQLARLAYEHPGLVKDVVTTRWKLRFSGSAFGPYNEGRADQELSGSDIHHSGPFRFRPNCAAYACSNDSAIMIAFRGISALALASWSSDTTLDMFHYNDIGAVNHRVHTILYSPRENCLADQLMHIITLPVNAKKSIFLTGYDMGGAMACLFAQVLTRSPDMYRRIKGIFTYGQPRIGNAKFQYRFERFFSESPTALRFKYASDIVSKIPNGYESYTESKDCRQICSYDGHIYSCLEDTIDMRNREDRFAFLLIIYRIGCNVLRRGSFVASVVRLWLLFVPGVCNHCAFEYERALRDSARTYISNMEASAANN